jgi:septum formation protein
VETNTSPTIQLLVLASGSPYRHALLQRLGLPFVAVAPRIDEASRSGEKPADTAVRLAEAKARAVADQHRQALIIGSDQVAPMRSSSCEYCADGRLFFTRLSRCSMHGRAYATAHWSMS